MSSRSTGTARGAFTDDPGGWRPNVITRRDTRFATGTAFLAWTFAVYDFILFGTLLPVISKDFGWSTAQATGISTAVAVGTFLVALLLGPLVDRIGRKKGMVLTVTGTALASGLTAATFNPAYLVGVRSIAGLGYSEQAVNATYLNEIYDVTEDETIRRHRGFVYSLVQGGWPIGVLLGALLAALFEPIVGWRGSFLIGTFPAVIIAVLRRKLKESPQFQIQQRERELAKLGRTQEADALARSYGLAPVSEAVKAPFVTIFQGTELRNTIFLGLGFLLNWFGTFVFSFIGTTVLTQARGVSFSNALQILILSNAVAFVGYVFHGWVGDRFGRRLTIAVGWLLGGLFFALMLTVAHGPVVVVFYSLGLFFQIGPYSALLFFMAECYTTHNRGTGTTFINALGQVGAIAAGSIVTAMVASGASLNSAALLVGAGGTALSGLVIFACRPVAERTEDDVELTR